MLIFKPREDVYESSRFESNCDRVERYSISNAKTKVRMSVRRRVARFIERRINADRNTERSQRLLSVLINVSSTVIITRRNRYIVFERREKLDSRKIIRIARIEKHRSQRADDAILATRCTNSRESRLDNDVTFQTLSLAVRLGMQRHRAVRLITFILAHRCALLHKSSVRPRNRER